MKKYLFTMFCFIAGCMLLVTCANASDVLLADTTTQVISTVQQFSKNLVYVIADAIRQLLFIFHLTYS